LSNHGAGRVRREQRTVALMIGMYCRAGHPGEPAATPAAPDPGTPGPRRHTAGATAGSDETFAAAPGLCPACAALEQYSRQRVEACRFGQDKPTCAHCPVHCFRPTMRERIRAVMRYAGPRMALHHPYLALRHLLDRRQPAL
jgi:Nitrous oxide-stimulated promoter